MSLLSLLATVSADETNPSGPLEDLPAVTETNAPGPYPTQEPWEGYAPILPTYDGIGSTLHFAAVDMVQETGEPFRGYRYWMVHSPFPYQDGTKENPSIVVSNNGYHWHDTEVGIANPVYPYPGVGYYSDNDMWWNPDLHRFEMMWRHTRNNETVYGHGHSYDGVHWSPRKELFTTEEVSPSVLRMAPYQWRMWQVVASSSPRRLTYRNSAYSDQGWSAPADCTLLTPSGAPFEPLLWHGEIIPHDGYLLGAFSVGASDAVTTPAVSTDGGITWRVAEVPLYPFGYRPALALTDDKQRVWLWDSKSEGGTHWPTVTQVPLSAWTTLLSQ